MGQLHPVSHELTDGALLIFVADGYLFEISGSIYGKKIILAVEITEKGKQETERLGARRISVGQRPQPPKLNSATTQQVGKLQQ